jgi:hypothetical protein
MNPLPSQSYALARSEVGENVKYENIKDDLNRGFDFDNKSIDFGLIKVGSQDVENESHILSVYEDVFKLLS